MNKTRLLHVLALMVTLVLVACSQTAGDQSTAPAGSTPPEESPGAPIASADTAPGESAAAQATPAASVLASPSVSSAEPPSSSAQASPAAPSASPAAAASGPFDPQRVVIDLEEAGSGFNDPLFVTHAGDGSGTVYVVEKVGAIKTLDGQVLLDITDRVNAQGSEQGLLGLAFHPRYRENGYFYVNYIDADGNTVVARFTAADGRGDPGSEKVILYQKQPAANHNGGMLTFGPDGYLYIGLGDGGGAGDSFGTGQNLETLLGKILRIDVDNGDPYAIPPDNPFVNNSAARPEIFSYGVRNPWRFSFDRATGDLYIADVGQNQYEWVLFRPSGQQGGENFGWPILEGKNCFQQANCDRTGITEAVLDYPHSEGCTVVGGYVYRGQQYPALQGGYVFGDFCSGRMWVMARAADGNFAMYDMLKSSASISSFGEDEAGELYMTDLAGGVVYRVTAQQR